MATDILTDKQHKAIAALLSEPTVKAAAEKIGAGERTIHTWLSDPTFDAAYRAARRAAVRQATARLQQTCSVAVQVMLTIMADKATPPATRLGAADKVLSYALQAIELEDLDARLSALEATHGS